MRVGKGGRHIVFEKADDAGELFDGDFSGDVGRVLEIHPGLLSRREGISFSRAMSERSRSSGEANLRSISEKAALEMPPE